MEPMIPINEDDDQPEGAMAAPAPSPDAKDEVSMAFAQKSLAKAIQARKEAALADNEEAYKQAQEKIKMWTEHLNDFKDKEDDEEDEEEEEAPAPSLLKQAGILFNNLK